METDDKLDGQSLNLTLRSCILQNNYRSELKLPDIRMSFFFYHCKPETNKKKKNTKIFPPPVCYQATLTLVCQQLAHFPSGREQAIHYSVGSESSHRNSSSHARGHPPALSLR